MLTQLSIQNFSIIESTQVDFKTGFHVLSGETGAGKSFLVNAIAFVLGARASADSIRAGAEEALVSASFEKWQQTPVKHALQDLGLSFEANEPLYLRRSLNTQNRSRAFLNDQPVTLKTLQRLGRHLVHQVSQHAAQQLLEENFLLGLLDQWGGHEKILQVYQKNLDQFQQAQTNYQQLLQRIEQAQEQEDFLRFQYEELKHAQLQVGEEAQLEDEKQRLKHRVTLADHSQKIHHLISEDEFALSDQWAQLMRSAEKINELDSSFSTPFKLFQQSHESFQEAVENLQDYTRSFTQEPQSFDEIENRLIEIHELKRKYRCDEAGLIKKQEQLCQQLAELEDVEVNIEEKKSKLRQSQKNLKQNAKLLSQARHQSALSLVKKLKISLKELNLPHAQMKWQLTPFEKLSEYTRFGSDQLNLLISFNPGEALRPLQEVISGGELSRLMLSLYQVVFPAQAYGTFIFDEVDAGVSGGVAELIGRKLATLAHKTQVLCITHLPQIASQAQWHYTVKKMVQKGRTFSQIQCLKKEERIQEIARMLAGVQITEEALHHAKELLKQSA